MRSPEDISFWDEAKCRELNVPVSVFIHDKEDPLHEDLVAEGQAICAQCPVRAECAANAEAMGSVGLWGGQWRELPEETITEKRKRVSKNVQRIFKG